MAKIKIIDSENLKFLKINIIEEIDQAQIQASMLREELERQNQSTQKKTIIAGLQASINAWDDKRSNFHKCLCMIEHHASEIEI